MGLYFRPKRLEDALDALGSHHLTVLAGGTDFYPARVGQPLDEDVLDVTALSGLRAIEDDGDRWTIGALVTWSDLAGADLPACFDGLKAAARAIGGVQVQNAGTLVGNVCNASPAADAVPNLMALDAMVHLASAHGQRSLPIADFIVGNRQTMRQPNELVTGVSIPKPAPDTVSSFIKLGARKYLVISILMVALVIEPEGDPENRRVGNARICVGACSPLARRLPALETTLRGRAFDAALGEVVEEQDLRHVLSPIDDIRGTADYRLDAAATTIRRGLVDLAVGLARQP
jgi:CO/xanthine dehydrogenase FAD-binding subunit